MGSSMKDDQVYTPEDCFVPFPFPSNWESNSDLELVVAPIAIFVALLMERENKGLTSIYNWFHDRDCDDRCRTAISASCMIMWTG